MDRVPPTTSLSLGAPGGSRLAFVAAWGQWATAAQGVTVTVSGDKALAGFLLTLLSAGGSSHSAVAGTVANVTLPRDGSVTVTVQGVDEAGNVDPVGATAAVFVDSAAPVTEWVTPPPLLSNSTTVTASVGASGERAGAIAAFTASLACVSGCAAVGATPRTVTVNASGDGTAALALDSVGSGVYNLTVFAEDVVGSSNPGGAWFVTIVDTEPPRCGFASPAALMTNRSVVDIGVWTADALDSVVVWAAVSGGGVATVAPAGDSVSVWTPAQGHYTVTLQCVDSAGNSAMPPAPSLTLTVSAPPHWTNVSLWGVCVGD